MKKLDLYYFPQCPFCQLVLSALRITGLEDKVTYHDIHDDHREKEFLVQDTGRATVPVLYIDGKPMRESKEIAKWLHDYANSLQKDLNKPNSEGNDLEEMPK